MSSPVWHRRRTRVRARAAARRWRRVQVILARFHNGTASADALRAHEAPLVERVEQLRTAGGATLVELLTRLGADRVEWSEPANGRTVWRYELSLTIPRPTGQDDR